MSEDVENELMLSRRRPLIWVRQIPRKLPGAFAYHLGGIQAVDAVAVSCEKWLPELERSVRERFSA